MNKAYLMPAADMKTVAKKGRFNSIISNISLQAGMGYVNCDSDAVVVGEFIEELEKSGYKVHGGNISWG